MNAYEKIRACIYHPNIAKEDQAIAALAELEKAAAEPAVFRYEFLSHSGWHASYIETRPHDAPYVRNITPLYAAPPAPVAEIREVRMFTAEEMEDAYKEGAYDVRYGSGIQNREWQNSVTRSLIQERAELGPTLGLVELKEPTPEECRDIWREAKANEGDGSKVCAGRAMFDACRAVMWPKEGL